MTILDIYNKLNTISPFNIQEEWDNSGLQIGSMSEKISEIILSLDIDYELISNAKDGTLFITHHPLIFSNLKNLDFNTYPANIVKKMINKNLKLISMHTNFDKTHLNSYVAQKILGLKLNSNEDFLATANVDCSFNFFCQKIKKALDIEVLRVVRCKEKIKSLSLCTGSGTSLIQNVKTDLFLTGDIKYHDAMMAKSLNLSMIDIGHFQSERFFSKLLYENLKDLAISVIIMNSKNPFEIIQN